MTVLWSKLVRSRGGGLYRGQPRQRNAETMAYLAEQNRKFQLFMGVVVEHLEQKVAVQQQAFETMTGQAPLDLPGWGGRSGSSFAISPEEIQALAEDELEMSAAISEVVTDSVATQKAENLLQKSMTGWGEEAGGDDMAVAGEFQEQAEAGEEAPSGWLGDDMMPGDPFGGETSTVAWDLATSLPEAMAGPIEPVLDEAGPASDRAYAPEPDEARAHPGGDNPSAGSALLAGWDDDPEDSAEMDASVAVKSLTALGWQAIPETPDRDEAIEPQNPEPEVNIEAGQEASETEEDWKTLLLGDV